MTTSPTSHSPLLTPQYDAIVIGGGHNGLVNGSYLAKSGLNTLVLERRSFIGGAAITEELIPGYKFTTFSYALSLIRPDIVQDLNLVEHGMLVLPMPNGFQVDYNGNYILLGADEYENYHELARHSPEDAEAYHDFAHIMDRVGFATKPLMDMIPPNIVSQEPEEIARVIDLAAYMEGLDSDVQNMMERLWSSSIADVLDEYFESDLLKAYIASSGIIGTKVSPKSKGSGLVWLFHKMGEYDGVFGEWGFHKEGNGGFTKVLAKAFQAFGGTIRTDAAVDQVIYENGVAKGVRLLDGDVVYADTIISALDPKRTFTQMVDPADLPDDLVTAINNYKFQGTACKVNFALSDLPTFPGLEGRTDIFQSFTNFGPSFDYLEKAFADCEAGTYSRRPYIDACIQSTIDPDMSPPGGHVMSCFVMYVPYHLKEGTWDTERDNMADAVEETIEEFMPGFRDLVIHREIVTPLDIERVAGLTEGNIFHGELFDTQMFFNRPAPGWNQYRTPIQGYYQCGSGTHPGGCVIGGPGKLAAEQILGDRRKG